MTVTCEQVSGMWRHFTYKRTLAWIALCSTVSVVLQVVCILR